MGKRLAERQIVVQGEAQRCRRVRPSLDARVKAVSYTVEYSYEQPHLMTWALVDGELEDVDGEFVLEDRGDGTTLATCALRLVTGSWLPGKAAHALNEQVTRSSVEGLKARVEGGA